MKQRAIRASVIALLFGGMSYLGQTQTGGEGFFSDPNQPAQGADLPSLIFITAIIWILAFLPWKKFIKRPKGK